MHFKPHFVGNFPAYIFVEHGVDSCLRVLMNPLSVFSFRILLIILFSLKRSAFFEPLAFALLAVKSQLVLTPKYFATIETWLLWPFF